LRFHANTSDEYLKINWVLHSSVELTGEEVKRLNRIGGQSIEGDHETSRLLASQPLHLFTS